MEQNLVEIVRMWVAGETIQVLDAQDGEAWRDVIDASRVQPNTSVSFLASRTYRVKPKAHRHYDMIVKWAKAPGECRVKCEGVCYDNPRWAGDTYELWTRDGTTLIMTSDAYKHHE